MSESRVDNEVAMIELYCACQNKLHTTSGLIRTSATVSMV